jgi:hypothetical protein
MDERAATRTLSQPVAVLAARADAGVRGGWVPPARVFPVVSRSHGPYLAEGASP